MPEEDSPEIRKASDEARSTLSLGSSLPSDDATHTFHAGQLVAGRFKIVRFLAKGGMGEVYEAEDSELQEHVALKTIRLDLARDTKSMSRFRREVNLSRKVTHPNVCRVFDLFQHFGDETVTFLTMELLHGETLAERLKRAGKMTEAEALPILRQMVQALNAAHDAGVVHRDFKSSNVTLVTTSTGGFRVVVTDFGLAMKRTIEGETGSDSTSGNIVGTPAYIAPEQLKGELVTFSADIYALGVVLYEMLTGQLPFKGDTPLATAMKRLTQTPASPKAIVPGLDSRWESVILRCLEAEPQKRFAKVSEVSDSFRSLNVVSSYLSSGILLKNRFLIRDEIGRGGLSVVYSASDQDSGKSVAIKLLVPPPAMERLARERMKRELEATRLLQHPSIVRIYDLVESDQWTFLVMELIHGLDLQKRIQQTGRLSSDSVRLIGIEIAEALDQAHQKGILHRDIKPQNILMDRDSRPRLTDFGSVRMEGQSTITQTGALVGTFDYMAPELLAGVATRGDVRSDVYSLALTLFFALTGALPNRPSPHLPPTPSREGYSPADQVPDIPIWLNGVIARASSSDPARRFPTMRSFLVALQSADESLAQPITTARDAICVLCGAIEPLGISICTKCRIAAVGGRSVLLFVRSVPSNRDSVAHRLQQTFLPVNHPATIRECASGNIPLARAHERDAKLALEYLAARGFQAQAYSKSQAWTAFPKWTSLAILLAVISGISAGIVAYKPLIWVSVIFAFLLFGLGLYRIKQPLLSSGKSDPRLPPKTQKMILEVLEEIRSGAARALLEDVVWLCRDLLPPLSTDPVPDEMVRFLEDLLESSCDAAKELHRLDQTLLRLETASSRNVDSSSQSNQAITICEQTRDALVQRLLEAVATLGLLKGEIARSPAGVTQKLKECTESIQNEMEIRKRVVQEMDLLLAEGRGDLA